MKGIMLDNNGDLLVRPRAKPDKKISGVVIDDTTIQNSAIVLSMNQGEYKEDPALGPNLIRFIRGRANKAKLEKVIQLHLRRAGIEYEKLKSTLTLQLKSM